MPSPQQPADAYPSIAEINAVFKACALDYLSQRDRTLLCASLDAQTLRTTLQAMQSPHHATRHHAIQHMRNRLHAARTQAPAPDGTPPQASTPAPAAAAPVATPTQAQWTLRSLNERLQYLGIPPMNSAVLSQALADHGRAEILRLLEVSAQGGPAGTGAVAQLTAIVRTAAQAPAQAGAVVPMHPMAPPDPADEIPVQAPQDVPAPAAPPPQADAQRRAPVAPAAARPSHRPAGAPAPAAAGGQATPHMQAKAYGKRAAITVELDQLESGLETVRFEIAPAIAERSYDWKRKLILMLTADELLPVLAVLLRLAPGVRLANHGPTKAKWLTLENQDRCIYLRAGDKDVPIMALPVTAPDAIGRLTSITMTAARRRYSGLTTDDIRALLRAQIAPRMPALPARDAAQSASP